MTSMTAFWNTGMKVFLAVFIFPPFLLATRVSRVSLPGQAPLDHDALGAAQLLMRGEG